MQKELRHYLICQSALGPGTNIAGKIDRFLPICFQCDRGVKYLCLGGLSRFAVFAKPAKRILTVLFVQVPTPYRVVLPKIPSWRAKFQVV